MRTLLTALTDGRYLARERSQSLGVEMLVYNGELQCFGYLRLGFEWWAGAARWLVGVGRYHGQRSRTCECPGS